MKKLESSDGERLVEVVRERYGRIARDRGACCAQPSSGARDTTGTACGIGYDVEELDKLPEGANLGLGCGAPIRHLALRPGEVVVDLGSGPGIDAFLAAERVGPEGRVIGIDMTPEMIDKARENAQRAGVAQVEFRQGRLEALPIEPASVDAVTSNCVINLVPDKARVFREIARVLRPGGRLVISDILLDGELPEQLQRDVLAYVGCVSGALHRERYLAAVRDAGLVEVELLEDRDFLGALGSSLPPEVDELIRRTGIDHAAVRGKVRSVTFRARKPDREAH